MCVVGTYGFCGWKTSDTPSASNAALGGAVARGGGGRPGAGRGGGAGGLRARRAGGGWVAGAARGPGAAGAAAGPGGGAAGAAPALRLPNRVVPIGRAPGLSPVPA